MLDIKENILLSKYTTFRVGGPARFFVEVKNEEDLIEALKYAKDNKLEFFILGGGSNVLVSDSGFSGLVIKMKLNTAKIDINSGEIKAGAGVSMARLVKDSVGSGLSGLEWAAGIPGTLGGAVRGNAGAFGGDIESVIGGISVLEVDELKIRKYRVNECDFSYRSSIFKQNKNLFIVSVVLNLQTGDKKEGQKKVQEIIQKRISTQPDGMASAGSFFINPIVKNQDLVRELKEDLGIESRENKIPAGWLIEKADLRGKKIGGAMVSDKHANFIVNTGNATAEDVIMLASLIKQQVRDKFGVELHEEVQYVGF